MANPEDHIVAARIATEAGNHLVELRERLFANGADTWTVKDTGDMEAHNFIIQQLTNLFPDDGILSEEGADDLTRLEKDRAEVIGQYT
jgi:3'(2'), 5'-bisphosphate nucleotidase